MATAAAMLIQAKPFRWNQAHTIQLHPVGRPFPSPDINYLNSKHHRAYAPKLKDLKLKSFFSEVEKSQSTKSKSKSGHACSLQSIIDHPRNQLYVIANNSLRALRKSAIAAVLLGLLVMYNPKSNSAMAAPMGWFGGRSPSHSSYSLSKYKRKNHDHPAMVAALYFLIFILGSIFLYCSSDYTCDDETTWLNLKLFCLAVVLANIAWFRVQTNVVKLQVLLSDSEQALQMDLNQIAESADTSTYEGLSYALNETVVALLRRHDFCISGYSSVASHCGSKAAHSYLDYLSINERINNQVTLANVNNMKVQSSPSQRSAANELDDERIVVTILVAAEAWDKLPAIYNSDCMKEALHTLLSIGSSDRIKAVEVLWTPQFSSSASNIGASEVSL